MVTSGWVSGEMMMTPQVPATARVCTLGLMAANPHFGTGMWMSHHVGVRVCVVMYYQPLTSPGVGGPYMFQWNDDRCNMKNNFICKYSEEKTARPPMKNTSSSHIDIGASTTKDPEISIKNTNETAKEAAETYIHFILIATIPVLTLFFIFIGVLCCCFIERRKQQRSETAVKEPSFWMSPHRRNSPNLEIYNVIKKQTDADLAGTRPNIRNTSFRVPSGEISPMDNLSGEYDNMAGNHSESGFVTLASTESGFVTNELYELCNDRYGRSTESGWVENEIYGY
ncbi:unnamed protein product [Staurois parvus]|uniref:Layilin n=1 Tax=Staurois parvus TaxID=386267 RepID=A0ABN9F525_9NEOB|nr:unnamed protein product [Staurois parvus]